jgi:hypothetical protein
MMRIGKVLDNHRASVAFVFLSLVSPLLSCSCIWPSINKLVSRPAKLGCEDTDELMMIYTEQS